MEYINGTIRKSYNEHYKHFNERLKERYSMSIDEVGYDKLHQQFHGIFKKGKNKTIGWVIIEDTKVWCLYFIDLKCMATVLPPNLETDVNELIFSCFGRKYKPLADNIYNCYLSEKEKIRKDFPTIKEAAIWYQTNTLFPPLHIDEYKHGHVKPFKIMNQIKNVLYNQSRYIELTVKKKPKL